MDKYCPKCKQTLDIGAFGNDATKPDKHVYACKECMRKWRSTWRSLHLHRENQRTRQNRLDAAHRNRAYIRTLMATGCVDCKITDIRVLEFDHVCGTKEHDISTMLARGYALSRLMQELDKCEVVCANCHRIRTHARSGAWRNEVR